MMISSISLECINAQGTKYAYCSSSYVRFDCCMACALFIQESLLHPKADASGIIQTPLSSTPIPRLSIDQPHPLENPSLRFLPIPTSGLRISPSLQVYPSTRPSLAYSATIEFPALDMLRVPSQIPLERRSRRPSCYAAAYSTPWTHYYINPSVQIGILGFRVSRQIGGFGRPIGILPHDQRFVQSIEAMATKRGSVDGKRFLIAFDVC